MESDEAAGQGASLETVIIFTAHMDELARFYQEGLQLGAYDHLPRHMGQHLGSVYLGFDQVEGAEGGHPSGATLWFTVDDLQDTFDRFVAMGAAVRYAPAQKPWGGLVASVYDLDGNILGLSQRQP
jgi:predicted enzyme related to lactoylglutathione lyase